MDGDWGSTSRAPPNWRFDSIWHVGMLGSHEILEVQPDGTISIAPGESLAKLFDEVMADNLQRKSLLLSCGVWGSFGGSDFPALQAPLMIRIKDRSDLGDWKTPQSNPKLRLVNPHQYRAGKIAGVAKTLFAFERFKMHKQNQRKDPFS